MTEARVVYYEKEGRELVSINAADPIRPSFSLSNDLDRALLLSTLAESLETFVSESDPAEPFYRLARHAMDALFADAPAALVAAYFDVWILKLSGLFPAPRECAGCGRPLEAIGALLYDERRPGFVGSECRHGETVRLTAEARRTLSGVPLGSARSGRAPEGSGRDRARVARLARRHFLGHELKSQRVLAEVLG